MLLIFSTNTNNSEGCNRRNFDGRLLTITAEKSMNVTHSANRILYYENTVKRRKSRFSVMYSLQTLSGGISISIVQADFFQSNGYLRTGSDGAF